MDTKMTCRDTQESLPDDEIGDVHCADSLMAERAINYCFISIKRSTGNPKIHGVYATLKKGGTEYIGEFETHKNALKYAQNLDMKYHWPITDHTL